MEQEKTDLTKILAVSGRHGLFRYIAQARSGAIVEALDDGKRTCFDAKNKLTALSDISIYTSEGEVKLREVFAQMHTQLGEEEAPSAKSAPEALKAFFGKVLPDYDGERFYVSHMKKVVGWYNELKQFASLEFTEPEAASGEAEGGASATEAEDGGKEAAAGTGEMQTQPTVADGKEAAADKKKAAAEVKEAVADKKKAVAGVKESAAGETPSGDTQAAARKD